MFSQLTIEKKLKNSSKRNIVSFSKNLKPRNLIKKIRSLKNQKIFWEFLIFILDKVR